MSWTKIFSDSNQGTSTTVITNGIDTRGSDLIVLLLATFSDNSTNTPTDNAGNTWTKCADYLVIGDIEIRIYYCSNPITEVGHNFQFIGSSTFPTIGAIGFSGSGSSPFDQQNGNASTTGVTSAQPGSITPSQSGELVVAAMAGRQAITGNSLSIDSGMTLEINLNNNGTSSEGLFVGWVVQGAAAPINPTFSWTTAIGYALAQASFEVAGGAPAGFLLVKN